MPNEYANQHVTDEERREFLKALGVAGTFAAGGITLNEIRQEMATPPAHDLASIGQVIQADLVGKLNADLLTEQQAVFADATKALPAVAERGLPTNGQKNDFQQISEAGQPIYDHLSATGFFESTTSHLPEFSPTYLEKSAKAFVSSAPLAQPLAGLDLSSQDGADLVATVVANSQQISDYHWAATDEIPREQIENGEFIPPVTQGAVGGVLLWLDSLDEHFWKMEPILTNEIHADATWHAHSMAAGFQLVTEGAKAIATDSNDLSNSELGALLSTGFAMQAIAQNLLPQDAYWITEEMQAPRRTDLKTITE